MLLHKIDIVTIVFLIFFGISFLDSSDKEKRIEKMNELIELKQRQRLEELRNLTTFQIDIQRVCNKFFKKLRDYNGKQSLQNSQARAT